MAKTINRRKSNNPSLTAKILSHLTLDKDLSINRDLSNKKMFAYWWQTFKANYSALVWQNLFCILLAIPFIALVFFIMPNLEQRWILQNGFNFVGDLGLGFGGATTDEITAIRGVYLFRIMFYSLIIPSFSLIGVGMSGLFYSSRNVAWGAKIKLRHYFRGIKKYWWQYTLAFTGLGVAVYGVLASIYGYLYLQICGLATWYMWIVMILACLILLLAVIFLVMYLPMVTMYSFKNKDKIKNSILLGIVLILPAFFLSVLFIGLPIALIWASFTKIILLVSFVVFGFAGYSTAIQCFGVYVADNYTTVLYQNMLTTAEKEKRRAAAESRRNTNKYNKKSNSYNKKGRK